MSVAYEYRPNVVIADSSNDTRDLLKYWLEAKGCRVLEAVNGEEVVELIRDERPDLLLMSLILPLLDGLEATRRVREHSKEHVFPIVCMSTYPTKEAESSALAAGCSSFIAKPFDFNFLNNLLSSLPQRETNDAKIAMAAKTAAICH